MGGGFPPAMLVGWFKFPKGNLLTLRKGVMVTDEWHAEINPPGEAVPWGLYPMEISLVYLSHGSCHY